MLQLRKPFSKAFGLAGLRVGWCYAPPWMIPNLYAARGMGTVNAAAQAGAIAVLDESDAITDQVDSIVAERERVAQSLSSMAFDVVPSSANFLLVAPPNSSREQADKLAEHLFNTSGIIVNRTRESGLEQFVRFSLSIPELNEKLLDSVKSY